MVSMKKKVLSLAVGAAVLSTGGFSSNAIAQDGSENFDLLFEEIIVTGIRKSLRSSLEVKKSADSVVDALSAEEIGQLPAPTIADALVLVPGITADSNRGIANEISLRGLGPNLTASFLNGREQATASPSRDIRLSQYPSELIQRVRVQKSSVADVVEGGVSGTVSLQTIRPLDYGKELTRVNLRGTYDRAAADNARGEDGLGARGTFAYVDQFLDNTLGVALGFAALDDTIASSRYANGRPNGNRDLDGDGTNDLAFPTSLYQASVEDTERLAGMVTLQWLPSDNLELNFSGLFSSLEEDKIREQVVYNYLYNNAAAGQVSVNEKRGDFVTNFDQASRTRVEPRGLGVQREDELTDLGLNLEWAVNSWLISGDLHYSKAEKDLDTTNILYRLAGNGFGVNYSGNTGDNAAEVTPLDVALLTTPSGIQHRQVDYLFEEIEDELIATSVDFSRSFEVAMGDDHTFSGLKFGLRYVDREKSLDRQDFRDIALRGNAVDDTYVTRFPFSDFDDITEGDERVAEWAAFDNNQVLAEYNSLIPEPSDGDLLGSWIVEEDRLAAYIRADFLGTIGGLSYRANFGVRYVDTDIESSSHAGDVSVVDNGDGTFDIVVDGVAPISVGNSYTDVLPSFNFNLDLREDLKLRFGAAQVVAFSGLNDLSAARNIDDSSDNPDGSNGTGSGGNPNLDPFRADQYDLSLEWYMDEDTALAVAVYYKDIESFIARQDIIETIDGVEFEIRAPVNGEGGDIQGIEFSYQQAFTSLPAPFNGLGILLNYNYADSSATVPSSTRDTAVEVDLIGFSEQIGNAVLYYSTDNLSLRTWYSYRTEYVNGESRIVDDRGLLNFSARYKINDMLKVYGDVRNALGEDNFVYFPETGRLNRIDYNDLRFSIGVEYTF